MTLEASSKAYVYYVCIYMLCIPHTYCRNTSEKQTPLFMPEHHLPYAWVAAYIPPGRSQNLFCCIYVVYPWHTRSFVAISTLYSLLRSLWSGEGRSLLSSSSNTEIQYMHLGVAPHLCDATICSCKLGRKSVMCLLLIWINYSDHVRDMWVN